MAAKKKARTRKAGTKSRVRETKPNIVMKDLHAVLNKHGITGKIESMAFTGQPPCTCPNGQPGVWRVIGGQLVCDCS